MARFNDYELDDEPSRTPLGWVCTARKTGEPQKLYLVKCEELSAHQLFETTFDPTEVVPLGQQPWVQRFLDRAKAQQAISAKSTAWAPVYRFELGEAGPFYVTDYFQRTADKLLSGRVRLPAAGLYEVVCSILGGLDDLRKAFTRAHGNLKPTNVLIGASQSGETRVVLCDPAAGPCNDADAFASDIESLGKVLYQLVLHRPFRAMSWPVRESEEWKALGKVGPGWLDLCNSLLEPNQKARPDLDQVRKLLAPLSVRKVNLTATAKKPAVLIAAAAAACLTIVAGGAAFFVHGIERSNQQKVQQANDQWLDAVLKLPREQLARFQPLGGEAPITESDRQVIAAALNREGASEPLGFSFSGYGSARDGAAAVVRIDRALVAAYAAELGVVGQREAEAAKRGWSRPKDRLDHLAAATPTSAADSQFLEHFQQLITQVPSSADAETRALVKQWDGFDADLQQASQTGDADIRSAAAALRTDAAGRVDANCHWSGDVRLQEFANTAHLLINVVHDGWPSQFDRARLAAEATPKLKLPPATLADTKQWLAVAGDYRRLDAGQTKQTIDDLNTRLSALDTSIAKAPSDQTKDLAAKRTAIAAQIKSLASLVHRDSNTLPTRKNAIVDSIAGLQTQLDQSGTAGDLRQYQAKSFGSPALDDVWKSQLQDVSVANFESKKSQLDTMQLTLQSLSQTPTIPRQLAGDWRSAAERQSQSESAALLQQLKGGKGLTLTAIDDRYKGLNDWLANVAALSARFPLPKLLTAADVTAWKASIPLMKQWAGTDNSPLGFISKDYQRLAALSDLVAEQKTTVLQDVVLNSKSPERTLIAWQHLQPTVSQKMLQTPTDLTAESTLRVKVRDALTQASQLASADQAAAVREQREQLDSDSQSRWMQLVTDPKTSTETFKAALDPTALNAFAAGTIPSQKLNFDRTRLYDVMLARARAAKTEQFDQATGGLRDAFAKLANPDQAALAELAALLSQPAANVQLLRNALASEKSIGWYLWPNESDARMVKFNAAKRDAAKRLWQDGFQPAAALAQLASLEDVESKSLASQIQASQSAAASKLQAANALWSQTQTYTPASIAQYVQAARGGNTAAIGRLGSAYLLGQGVAADPTTAVRLLTQAADLQDPDAALQLGTYYVGREQNNPQAGVKYLSIAAAQDNTEAQRSLGIALLQGGAGVPVDLVRGKQMLTAAASKNDFRAMLCLGGEALLEDDVAEANRRFSQAQQRPPADSSRAVSYFKQQSSLTHDGRPELILAKMYQLSSAVTGDLDSAQAYCRQAIQKNNTAAKTLLPQLTSIAQNAAATSSDQPPAAQTQPPLQPPPKRRSNGGITPK